MGERAGPRHAARHARRRHPAVVAVTVLTVLAATVGVSGAMWLGHRDASRHSAAAAPRAGHGAKARTARLPAAVRVAAGRPALGVADRRLSAVLGRELRRHAGDLAVAVLDESAGTLVAYHPRGAFLAAGVMKADILAATLWLSQRARHDGHAASRRKGILAQAAAMIRRTAGDAATRLWTADGGAAGLRRADVALGLRHTLADPFGAWGLTSTTVTDQVRLLSQLAGPSALTAASRAVALRLLRLRRPGQRWGVAAAAPPGAAPAVQNGALRFPLLWIVNSVGIVRFAGQLLCVAVLSDRQPTLAAGIRQARAAVLAAARLITGASRHAQAVRRAGPRSGAAPGTARP